MLSFTTITYLFIRVSKNMSRTEENFYFLSIGW